ncbi:hypothetical protein DDZ14_11175 [Maritimibacter sp. 55A14]|uniref:Hint domain-containing protein n=1 Tax=Maritimibacter sp. 55A14 TaxID=2174844 RepID=UPI000D61536D|nr:Hint domain-containing protein [Maritimibacter sp. 55A14]PWE32283.1 hypothetical protein DDZ14_11175 [Maritimibacter sp. 55A14]
MANVNAFSSGSYVVTDNDNVRMDIPGGGDVVIGAPPGGKVGRFKIDFRNSDNAADKVTIDLTNFAQDGLRIDLHHYDPSDEIQFIGLIDAQIDPAHPDELAFTFAGPGGEVLTGTIFVKDGGEKDLLQDPPPIIYDSVFQVVCFAGGALIETDGGHRRVEDLAVGDMLRTRDNGMQPLRWIGRRDLDRATLDACSDLRPVRVRRDAFGPGRPFADLCLSPQHRIFLDDWRAELLFGEPELLVAVKHLRNDRVVVTDHAAPGVSYFHLLLDRHEVIYSNGLESESLHLGDMAQDAIGGDTLDEVLRLFPEAAGMDPMAQTTACPVLRGFEGRTLAGYPG